jgi:hypothetical protein
VVNDIIRSEIMREKLELDEFNREFRREVRETLKYLREQNDAILKNVATIREEFVHEDDFQEMSKRLLELENNWSKLLGGILAFNTVLAIAVFLIDKVWK